MEAEPTAEELYDQSFIDVPAILDKHKAAAVVCDGKYYIFEHYTKFSSLLKFENKSYRVLFSVCSCS